MQKRANVSLIFTIIAVALIVLELVLRGVLMSSGYYSSIPRFIPGFFIAFIVPVFVAVGRKAPKAKKAFAIIAFVFLGIQCIFALLLLIRSLAARGYSSAAFSWFINLVNGSGVLSGIVYLLRGHGWAYFLTQLLYVAAEVFFILKNVLGAVDLCRKERAAAPQGYYAPQYAQPQQYAPQAAPQQAPQYAAPAAAPAPAQEAPKFCPNCGTRIEGSGAFCSGCGQPFENMHLSLPADGMETAVSAILAAQADGVFCASETYAFLLGREFRKAGVRIPEDVSLMGMEDPELNTFFEPPITAVGQDFGGLARAAVEELVRAIGSLPTKNIRVPCLLFERESVANPDIA